MMCPPISTPITRSEIPLYLAAAERALTFLLDYAVENGRVYRTVSAGKGA